MSQLFHKFQSRHFQFSLELLARFCAQREIPNAVIDTMAAMYRLDYKDQCLEPLEKASLIRKTPTGIQPGEFLALPQIPLSQIENEYLDYILALPEARLFLDDALRQELSVNATQYTSFPELQRLSTSEAGTVSNIEPVVFRKLLDAMRNKQWISYTYRTNTSHQKTQASAVPWKMEYSAFDRRWWIILYLPDEHRTVKAKLANLHELQFGKCSNITDGQILSAMEKLLAPEEITLRILPERKALERCAMVFERQMFQSYSKEADGSYVFKFRYYKFDENEILRNLLYLGSSVQLLAPESMRAKMLDLLDKVLR